MLAEECAEVIQAVTKALRHGLNSHNPNAGPASPNNQESLRREVTDLVTVLWMLDESGLDLTPDAKTMARRMEEKLRYTHYQGGSPL